jgi:hypothetical protein
MHCGLLVRDPLEGGVIVKAEVTGVDDKVRTSLLRKVVQ